MGTSAARPIAVGLAALAAAAALAGAGCREKRSAPPGPPPEVTGLAAVPASAEVVLGIDVAPLAGSPIVVRAVEQLLAREPALASRWEDLRQTCKLEIGQVQRLMLALGPPPQGGKVGTGPMLLVATGKLVEPEIVKCVREVVGKGGGTLVVKSAAGARPLYQVKDGARTQFIAFGRPDTVILGSSAEYVEEAVGAGKKASDHPELARWLALADQRAPVWVVGRVAERLRTGLVRASSNSLKDGARAFVGSLDLTRGVKLELRALMGSAEDAKQLKSLVGLNLAGLTWAAQSRQLGRIVNKLAVTAEGDQTRFSLELTMDEVNQLLSVLDGGGPPAQDSPPAGGSASAPAPPQ